MHEAKRTLEASSFRVGLSFSIDGGTRRLNRAEPKGLPRVNLCRMCGQARQIPAAGRTDKKP
jgi:hypothetical protein